MTNSAGIAQSVQRFDTAWKFRNPMHADNVSVLHNRPDRPPRGPFSLLYNGYRSSFAGVKRPGRGVDHPPHLAPRLRISTATPLLPVCVFYGMLEGDLYI
jgi:hypothetical protein